MKIFLENGTSIEWAFDTFYVRTLHEETIHINKNEENRKTDSEVYVENGDSIAVQGNQLYIYSKLSGVNINDKKQFSVFPNHISYSFRDFCSHAEKIKKSTILENEFIVARFRLFDMNFEIISPSSSKGKYTFLFKDLAIPFDEYDQTHIKLMNELQSYNFEVEYSRKKKTFIMKTKRFEQSTMYHVLIKIASFRKYQISNSDNFIA